MFFYSDSNGGKFDNPAKIWDMNGTNMYMSHYGNFMILDAMAKAPKSFAEGRQIEKELEICRKKLKFWERHPNTDMDVVNKEKEKLHRLWAGKR